MKKLIPVLSLILIFLSFRSIGSAQSFSGSNKNDETTFNGQNSNIGSNSAFELGNESFRLFR